MRFAHRRATKRRDCPPAWYDGFRWPSRLAAYGRYWQPPDDGILRQDSKRETGAIGRNRRLHVLAASVSSLLRQIRGRSIGSDGNAPAIEPTAVTTRAYAAGDRRSNSWKLVSMGRRFEPTLGSSVVPPAATRHAWDVRVSCSLSCRLCGCARVGRTNFTIGTLRGTTPSANLGDERTKGGRGGDGGKRRSEHFALPRRPRDCGIERLP